VSYIIKGTTYTPADAASRKVLQRQRRALLRLDLPAIAVVLQTVKWPQRSHTDASASSDNGAQKLIHHAIGIAAFNTARSLAYAIITDTGYGGTHDDAHALVGAALARSGDIISDHHTTETVTTPIVSMCCHFRSRGDRIAERTPSCLWRSVLCACLQRFVPAR
jgi:hypothetical protein